MTGGEEFALDNRLISLLPLAELTWLGPLGFAAGIGLLTWLLLRKTFRRMGKRTKSGSGPYLEKQPRPTHVWDGAKEDATARFNRQQVELHDLARDLNGQLDSKLVILRELVAQSETQIERLETLLEEANPQADGASRG